LEHKLQWISWSGFSFLVPVFLFLLCPPQIHMREDRLISWEQKSPVLRVVIGVDDVEHRMLHVPVLDASGNINKIKFQPLAVGRLPGNNARAITGVAIMNQQEAIVIQVEHGDWMVVLAGII